MRTLYILTPVFLVWVLLSNLARVWYPVTLGLWPFGSFTVPAVGVGLLAIAVTALLYAAWHGVIISRLRGQRVTELRRLDEVTRALQNQEETRLAEFQRLLLGRLDQFEARALATPSAASSDAAAVLDPMILRIERVRDEISADIGQLEDTLLRALDRPR